MAAHVSATLFWSFLSFFHRFSPSYSCGLITSCRGDRITNYRVICHNCRISLNETRSPTWMRWVLLTSLSLWANKPGRQCFQPRWANCVFDSFYNSTDITSPMYRFSNFNLINRTRSWRNWSCFLHRYYRIQWCVSAQPWSPPLCFVLCWTKVLLPI